MNFSRTATIDWKGGIMDGGGQVKAGTGAFTLPVSFPKRIGDAEGTTSPEELIAAAHAACYAMVIAGTLGRSNATADSTKVTCTVSAEKTDAGIKLVSSKLAIEVTGLKGMDANTFHETAKAAESKCPVSNSLRNSMAITVEPTVK